MKMPDNDLLQIPTQIMIAKSSLAHCSKSNMQYFQISKF